jgi:gliding motility-associated-like protein
MFGIDNGFIFDWSVQFADYLYPDLLSFTPTYGIGCDSTFISGQFIIDNGIYCDSILIVPTSAGDFIYTYTAYDDFGCVFTDQLSINAYPGPIAYAGEDFNFCGVEYQLEGEVTNPVTGINYNYSWIPSNPLSNPSIAQPMVEDITESQEFVLQIFPIQDPNCVVSDTVFAFIPPFPPSETLDSLEFCLGSIEPITAPGESGIGYTYQWYYSFDDTDYINLQDASSIYSVDESGYYYVDVSEPLCNFSTNTYYYVDVVPCEIIIPNVFTPNGNSTNDSFEIFGLDRYPGSTMRIYNRWGNLVYESNSYYDQWKGTDMAEGTYFFVLGVKKTSGFEYYEGHLTLLRD